MISLSAKVSLCVFLCISLLADAKLTVRSPKALGDQFNEINNIDYTVLTPQNKITYKRNFIGNVILADPSHACSNLTSIETIGDDAVYNPILVASWGECHYAQKVQNAEVAGAKMLLLVLKHDMPANHPAVRQIPLNTNIEVLAISSSDGDILINFLKQQRAKDDPDSVVEITYSYDQEKNPLYKSNNKVSIDFWFSAADLSKASYQFISDLKDILSGFGDHFEFSPNYVVWQSHEQIANPRCISGGRYCDPEHHLPNQLTGAAGVVEDLRQMCIRETGNPNHLDDAWWRYVTNFGNRCLDKNIEEIEQCRSEAYTAANIDSKAQNQIKECMSASFESSKEPNEYTTTTVDNSRLSRELSKREQDQVDHYPALYVNKQRYTGSYRNRFTVQDFICSHFVQEDLPQACRPATTTGITQVTSHDTGVYVLLIIGSILVMAIMLYCVRRTVKRQVMGRMQDEISHIVTQYQQFKDKSNTMSHDDDGL